MQKILVLDDNADVLEAVSMVLLRKKLDVEALRDPGMLEESIAHFKPDLLLMDISMGLYDGRALCRRLKNDPRHQDLVVVLFSGQTYTAESIAESGADAILAKPFPSSALFFEIERLLHA